MILGFTGTRKGMTKHQYDALSSVVVEFPDIILHGGAEGADQEFHYWCCDNMIRLNSIEIYPTFQRYQKYWSLKLDHKIITIRGPYIDPLERNKLMVERCDQLLATPFEPEMITRSGTWATVRYAIAHNKPVTIIHPDGLIINP